MASDHYAWCVLRLGIPAQRLVVSSWICPWYWSHIDRVWRIRNGMGVPSSNYRFCGGERRRGIGTNSDFPGTSRAQNSVGTSFGVGGLSPSSSRFSRTYGPAALAAQRMMAHQSQVTDAF